MLNGCAVDREGEEKFHTVVMATRKRMIRVPQVVL